MEQSEEVKTASFHESQGDEANIYEPSFVHSSSYYDVRSYLSELTSFCLVCNDVLTPSNKAGLPCHTAFCRPCISKYLETKILDLEVLRITCPSPGCGFTFTNSVIEDFISPKAFEKFLKLVNNEQLNKNPYLRWCPVADCQGYDVASESKTELICNECSEHYCFYCGEIWKEKHKCKMSGKTIEYWFKKGIRYCPNCKRKVEKALGCDHMTCIKCRFEWCWLCGEVYSYDHYLDCEVMKYRRMNPSWGIILGLIFVMLLYVLFPLIAVVPKIPILGRHSPRWLLRCFTCVAHVFIIIPICSAFLLAICPLFIVIFPFVVSVTVIMELLRNYSYFSWYWIVAVIGSILVYPLIILAVILGIVGIHVAGWLLLLKKFKIGIIRCYNETYMLPKTAYAKNTMIY